MLTANLSLTFMGARQKPMLTLPSVLCTQRLSFLVGAFCVRFGALELAAPADFSPRGQAPPSALGAKAEKIYTLIVRRWKSSISRCSKGKPMLTSPRVLTMDEARRIATNTVEHLYLTARASWRPTKEAVIHPSILSVWT
jgi:hypothetical protein